MKAQVTNPRIQNSIKIINTAVKKRISLTSASIASGFGKNYVSDVKLTLDESIDAKRITKQEAKLFKTAIKEYEKAL